MAKPKEPKKDTSPKVYQREKIGFDLHIRELPWTPKQRAMIDLGTARDTRILFVSGEAGTSKAQPLDAKILTPTGWKVMGSLSVGDLVATQDGTFTKITGVFPQGIKEVCRVTFSDGSSTECCYEHLWQTQNYLERNNTNRVAGAKRGATYKNPKPGTTRTTAEIATSLKHLGRANHTIPIVAPIQFTAKQLVIPPYIMGVLLGDGCIRMGTRFSSWDDEIVARVKQLLPNNLQLVEDKRERHYSITGVEHNQNPFRTYILENGLNVNAPDKHIPDEYLFSSVEDRLELLRGLMDTDGCCARSPSGTSSYESFGSSSKQLALHVQYLVQSLGGTATISEPRESWYYLEDRTKHICKPSYGVYINFNPKLNPFHLVRKANKYIPKTKYVPRRYIVAVESVGQKDCQCIRVEHPSHLYVTNDFIVTHNTTVAMRIALQLLNEKKVSDIICVRAAVESSDASLGYLPGDINDKYGPYMGPFEDKLEELLPALEAKRLKTDAKLIYLPINFVRGASWTARCIILDESQNFTIKELRTLMTRVGKFTKMIICADSEQSDLPKAKQGGFDRGAKMFDTEEARAMGIYSVGFTSDEIVRSELCKFIVKTFKSNERTLHPEPAYAKPPQCVDPQFLIDPRLLQVPHTPMFPQGAPLATC